jgi:hypothetical protein
LLYQVCHGDLLRDGHRFTVNADHRHGWVYGQ